MTWNKLRCFWKMYIFPSRFWKGTFSSRLFYCDLLGSRGVFLKIYLRRVALAVTTWQRCWFFWKRTKRAQCRICHFPMMGRSWSRIYQRNATFGRIACCALAYQPEDRVCKQCLLQSWQVFVSDRFEQMCKVAKQRDAKKWVERWGPERWVFKYLESFTSWHLKILYFVSFLSFSWLATPWFGVGGLWPPNSFTNLGSIRVTSVLGSSNFRTGRGKDDDNSPSETQLTKVITYCWWFRIPKQPPGMVLKTL